MLSRLDDVGANVRLRARLTDPADEDVDSVEGDPVPLTVSHPQVRRIHCINYRMAGLGAVPMATVFRTPLNRRTGLRLLACQRDSLPHKPVVVMTDAFSLTRRLKRSDPRGVDNFPPESAVLVPPTLQSSTATAIISGSAAGVGGPTRRPAQVLSGLLDAWTTVLATSVTPETQG